MEGPAYEQSWHQCYRDSQNVLLLSWNLQMQCMIIAMQMIEIEKARSGRKVQDSGEASRKIQCNCEFIRKRRDGSKVRVSIGYGKLGRNRWENTYLLHLPTYLPMYLSIYTFI